MSPKGQKEVAGSRFAAKLKATFSRSRSHSPTGPRASSSTTQNQQSQPLELVAPQPNQQSNDAAVVVSENSAPSLDANVSTNSAISGIEAAQPLLVPTIIETFQTESTVVLSNNATPSNDTPPLDSGGASSGHRDLWQEAFEKLSESARSRIKKLAGDTNVTTTVQENLGLLVNVVEKKRDECDKKTWKWKIGGYEIILRDYAVKLIHGLQVAGDVAVEFAPGPTKLVWSVIRGVMTVSALSLDDLQDSVLTRFPPCAGTCCKLCGADGRCAHVLGTSCSRDESRSNLRAKL